MKKVKSYGMDKMGDFMEAMISDEQKRSKDGYFDMGMKDRDEYDSVRDKFRKYFESDDFSSRGWDSRSGRGGRDSDESDGGRGRGPGGRDSDGGRGRGPGGRDGESSDDGIDGVVGKIKSMLGGGAGSILEKFMSGGGIKDMFSGMMGKGGDSDGKDW